MSLPLTLVLLAATAGLTAVFGWLGSRPPDLHRGPRMAPWRFMMLLSAAGALLLVVHLVNLMGVATGR